MPRATQTRAIALIRHGDYLQPADVPSALLPHGLTAAGETQAQACVALIREFCSGHKLIVRPVLHSSRQLRAYQTATIIAAGLTADANPAGLAYVVEEFEDLAERSVGAMANLTVQAIESIVDNDPRYPPLPVSWKSSSDYCLPYQGAESLRQAGTRVAAHLKRIWPAIEPLQLQVIVGHGASIRHAAAELGIMAEADIARLSMHHARPVFITRDNTGGWHQVGGEWKTRQRAGDEFGE
jgi:2,3-bisphosphoglycerate-dependent phosphoglycerate mutase